MVTTESFVEGSSPPWTSTRGIGVGELQQDTPSTVRTRRDEDGRASRRAPARPWRGGTPIILTYTSRSLTRRPRNQSTLVPGRDGVTPGALPYCRTLGDLLP